MWGRAVMEASHVMAQIIRTGSPCIKEIIGPASYSMTMTPANKNQDVECVHIMRPRVDELNSLALKPLECTFRAPSGQLPKNVAQWVWGVGKSSEEMRARLHHPP